MSSAEQIELTRLLPVSQLSMGFGEESEFISPTAAYKFVRWVYWKLEKTSHPMVYFVKRDHLCTWVDQGKICSSARISVWRACAMEARENDVIGVIWCPQPDKSCYIARGAMLGVVSAC